MRLTFLTVFLFNIVAALLSIGVTVGLVCAAVHFIRKFW